MHWNFWTFYSKFFSILKMLDLFHRLKFWGVRKHPSHSPSYGPESSVNLFHFKNFRKCSETEVMNLHIIENTFVNIRINSHTI